MSRFSSAAALILACTAPSSGHAWIAFHRCVEAHARLTGERFSALFKRIGAPHGITRRGSVDVAALQAATRAILAERDALLEERAAWIAARKVEKRAGRREPGPSLAGLERRHREATSRAPTVGYWGWRALREGELGARVSIGVPGAPPVNGGVGGRVVVDCRGRGPPEGIAGALAVTLGGKARQLWVLVTPTQLAPWASWDGGATLRELGRTSWGGAAVVVVSALALTPAQEGDLRALEHTLRPQGWRVHLVSEVG